MAAAAAVLLPLPVVAVEMGVQLHQQVEAAALLPLLEAAAALLHPLPVVEVEAARLLPQEAEVVPLLQPGAEAVALRPPQEVACQPRLELADPLWLLQAPAAS